MYPLNLQHQDSYTFQEPRLWHSDQGRSRSLVPQSGMICLPDWRILLWAKTLSENCLKHFYLIDDCYICAFAVYINLRGEMFEMKWNEMKSLPFILAFVVASSYIVLFTYTYIHSSTPRYLSAHQITPLARHTIKCFLQINKSHQQTTGISALPNISLAIAELCRAGLPCHKSKLHMLSSFTISHSPVNHSFQNIRSMLQQLNSLVWATCQ